MVPEGYFPSELKRAIKAIDNETRVQLVAELLKSGELSYTQILNILKIRKGSLTHHLTELAKGALVRNFVKDELRTEYESFYSLTKFGESFIEALHATLYPSAQYSGLPRIAYNIDPLSFPTDSTGVKTIGVTQYETDLFSTRT